MCCLIVRQQQRKYLLAAHAQVYGDMDDVTVSLTLIH